ncbi:dash complex subunit spc34 [Botrytis cinerea]
MSLLERHLEQIALSADSIASLPQFELLTPLPQLSPPQIFTNALLSNQDITALIRDTEPHERALFSVPPPPPPPTQIAPEPKPSKSRRQTVFNVTSGEVAPASGPNGRAPRRNTAVAAVLGAELHSQVRKTETGKGEIDIEVLLKGAEKLNGKVQKQTRELERMNRGNDAESGEEENQQVNEEPSEIEITDEDLRREEREIRELERKKKALEERVTGMERDLGGLLR